MNIVFRTMHIVWKKSLILSLAITVTLFSVGYIPLPWLNKQPELTSLKHAEATYQYDPSGGAIVTGTAPAILGATAAAAEGVNMGDWRGTEADDNLHWGITSTASGYNAYLDLGGVRLNGANKFIIQTEFDEDATAPATLIQICDWVSTTGVHAAADAQCTGGGWRNLNLNDTTLAPTTGTAYDFEIYDGYWNSTATTKISTPLSNFINGSNTVRIRYYSTTNTTSIVNIDYLRLFAVVNPVYSASGATQISGGTPLGDYSLANIGGAGQTGSDNVYFRVPGTAGAISNFYLSHTGVKTYSGANTILYRAEYSCSTTGINIKPKIYNFTSTLWEDLTTANIACSATDATNAWAVSMINVADYVNNGEVRVGWYGLANGTQEIRLDTSYIMIGTVNNGTSAITFGSNSAGTSANTRDLDMTGTSNTWNILSADESNTQAFATNGFDGDNDATVEEASAANMDFTLLPPGNAVVTGLFFAGRYMSGVAGTVNLGIADASGATSIQGGWSQVGANGTTALVYSDNISMASVASGGAAGWYTNPEDYVDTVTGRANMRLRTSASGATTNNSVAQWDFAMLSLQWVETPLPAGSLTFSISDNTIGFGTLSSSQTKYATGAGGGQLFANPAHTISAASNSIGGYVITIGGTTLTSGPATIDPIGGTPSFSTLGTEQFGITATKSAGSGSGTVLYPYTAGMYALDVAGFPSPIFQNMTNDNLSDTYDLIYVANISAATDAGDYTAVLTYTATAAF